MKEISNEGNNCIITFKISSFLFCLLSPANPSLCNSFGENTKPLPQIPPLKESIKEALDNRILLYLAIAAFLTIITGMIADPKWGWIEGVSIYVAIVIIVTITSGNDYVKDKQFVELSSHVKDESIAVIRGKYGVTQSVNIFDLVVGDVILLETGARVPADCVVIESSDLSVDESFYSKDEKAGVVFKQPGCEDNYYDSPDPFLLSQTMIASGMGKAVVCAVGPYSRRGVKDEKLDTNSKTPLQQKLENMAGTLTKWGILASLAIFIANVVNMSISIAADDSWNFASAKTLTTICQDLTLIIVVIIVAVPEGLPMTITLSLAYSVMRIKDEGVLVKNLDSPEVMGSVEEICTGKTATLTKNEMKVEQFYAQSMLIKNSRKNTLFHCNLDEQVVELIKEGILFNCEARIEMDEKALYQPVGSGTEVGLIKFLQDAEIPVHEIIKRKLS
jgi:Ca2+ transporting ATPase